MAKRSRGTTSRPGQRPPLQRRPARPARAVAATPPEARPTGLTPQEEARAAELEASIVADERQAEEQDRRTRSAARSTPTPRATSSLEVAAADEYAYVARDVRRIAIVGGSLFAILAGLWVILQLVGPIAI